MSHGLDGYSLALDFKVTTGNRERLWALAGDLDRIVVGAGGPADLVRDGVDGFLAPCGNVGRLAGAVRRLVQRPAERAALGGAGRARVRDEFRWEDKLELVREVYREVTEGRQAKVPLTPNPSPPLRGRGG